MSNVLVGDITAMPTSVLLWWVPVGAGGHLVRHTSHWWELAQAARGRRAPQQLFHTVLEIVADGDRYVIEMAPAWGASSSDDRGVVATGLVGLPWLGGSRFFRYEVRRWRNGVIPDRRWAVGGPVAIAHDGATADRLLQRIERVPTLTWGRDASRTGDMWELKLAHLVAASRSERKHREPPPTSRWPSARLASRSCDSQTTRTTTPER